MADSLNNIVSGVTQAGTNGQGLNTSSLNVTAQRQIKSMSGADGAGLTRLISAVDKIVQRLESENETSYRDSEGRIDQDILEQALKAATVRQSNEDEILKVLQKYNPDVLADYGAEGRKAQTQLFSDNIKSLTEKIKSIVPENGATELSEEQQKEKASLLSQLDTESGKLKESQRIEQLAEINKKLEELHKDNDQIYKDVFLPRVVKADSEEQEKLNKDEAILKTLGDIKSGLIDLSKEIYNNLKDIAVYRGQILTRLNGAGVNFEDIMGNVNQFSLSAIVNEQELTKNISAIASKGIAYNLETKAFLETVKDDVVTTFNAVDATLLRIERLQQTGSSVARMGMEASLTEYLNGMYQDSTYLNNTFDSVRASLLEAESTMTAKAAAEFEFVVQKWLGTLYESGADTATLTSIAGALGALGSGNVNGVNGSMLNLLAMSANQAGLDYAGMLVEGLNASNTNKLLEAMVGYLQQMTRDNNVLTNAIGNVYGFKTSDMMALQNINAASIAGTVLGYGDMEAETASMVGSIGERIGAAKEVQNVIDNLKYGMATGMASIPALNSIFQILYDAGGLLDVAIPSISAMGFGVSFEGAKISDFLKAALGGLGVISGLGSAINSLASGVGITGVGDWLNEGSISSVGGSGLTGGGNLQTTSQRTVMNTASEDLTKGTQASALSEAEKTQGIELKKAPEKTTDDLYNQLDRLVDYMFINRRALLVDVNNHKRVAESIKDEVLGEGRSNLGDMLDNLNFNMGPVAAIDDKLLKSILV